MTLDEVASAVPGFSNLNHADLIQFFSWYLHTHAGKSDFMAADIAKCYDDLHLGKPTSISPFLGQFAGRTPPVLINQKGHYRLERRAREALDLQYGQRAASVAVIDLLSALPTKLSLQLERAYLEEALICFRNKAFRASIVMAWNLAYDHLCNWVMAKHLLAFNTQLPLSFPKADLKAVSKKEDFQELKESQVIQVCRSANLITGSLHKILKEKLDRRNVCAHPSGVLVGQLQAEDAITDLLNNVVVALI